MLEAQVAVVTGASRGIGRAIALALAGQGATVVVNYVQNDQAAEQVVQTIREAGGQGVAIRANVADLKQVREMFHRIDKDLARLDILVNNAGITRDRSLRNMDPDEWAEVIATNLTGVFHCTRAAIEMMLVRRYGRIVNISSVIGQTGNFGQSNYAASKAGILGFTKSVALETAKRGLTVNAICPGFIDTEMVGVIPEDIREKIIGRIPLGRLGMAEEIAQAVLFLVSPEAAYITGQTINLNGGLYV